MLSKNYLLYHNLTWTMIASIQGYPVLASLQASNRLSSSFQGIYIGSSFFTSIIWRMTGLFNVFLTCQSWLNFSKKKDQRYLSLKCFIQICDLSVMHIKKWNELKSSNPNSAHHAAHQLWEEQCMGLRVQQVLSEENLLPKKTFYPTQAQILSNKTLWLKQAWIYKTERQKVRLPDLFVFIFLPFLFLFQRLVYWLRFSNWKRRERKNKK